MRFNLISKDGDGIGFAVRLQDEGNDVRVFIDGSESTTCGDGLVPKVGSIHDLLLDADPDNDTFVFDTSGDGLLADWLRHHDYAVVGACPIADRLERDREFGLKVMSTCGDGDTASIQIPKSMNFTSFEEAMVYVESNPDKRLVYKPSNLLGDKSPSHVAYNAEDMLQLLENVQRDVSMAEPEFVLQEFHKGLAVSTEMWFDGQNALPLGNHTFERKELMDGNIGPSGGCTGNIVWACHGCALCDEIKKLIPWLKENNYVGPIDLNAIVADDGIYGLEFTPRFGYDATPTLLWELLSGDLGRFLFDFARQTYGSGSGSFVTSRVAAGLRVTVPPWPSEKFNADVDVPIFGLDESEIASSFLYNVKKGEITKLATAGVWGIVALFIGGGNTIDRAFREPYKLAEQIHVSNKQYRTDLVKQFEKDSRELGSLIGTEVES